MKTPLRDAVHLATCATALAAVLACGEERSPAAGDVASAEQAATTGGVSAYFIVTRLDRRMCPSPMCGGYFVKLVNRDLTRCADGTVAPQCHALILDLSPSGLSNEEAARFERDSFSQKHGLVRGQLVKKEIAAGISADVLVGTEAWEGQALSTPTGWFNRLTSTGQLCVTYPCDSFQGERLNTYIVTLYNAVDLASSGAPPEAVKKGYEALQGAGILAAGVDVPMTGPAGEGLDFRASEFYLRLVPCAPQKAVGVGACDLFLGHAWDGSACVGLSGCSCEGPDCGLLYQSLEQCEQDHAHCVPQSCGMPGLPPCAAAEYCDFPDGSKCGAMGEGGICRPRPDMCVMVIDPVCGCDGTTYGNDCEAARAGVDVAYPGWCTQ